MIKDKTNMINLNVEDEETDANVEMKPFDPDKISINTKPVTMDSFIRRYKQKSIIMNPDFQRKEVWTPVQKSLLIESLMLRIPIPMFYVSSDEKGILTVIDGLQRLSAIRDFVIGQIDKNGKLTNKLRLGKLEYWKEYEGKTFDELPDYLQNRILETEFTFTIVNPGTPEEVKLNIFKRINTGGMTLNPQEIRNALYVGNATKLLRKISQSKDFQKATCNSIHSERMEDDEIILRCLYFYLMGYEGPEAKMDDKLCRTMIELNSKEETALKSIYDSFVVSMTRCFKLFGKQAFRRNSATNRRRPINKCLFEVWGYHMAKISESDYTKIVRQKNTFIEDYNSVLQKEKFIGSITQGTWSSTSIKERFVTINRLIQKYTYVK